MHDSAVQCSVAQCSAVYYSAVWCGAVKYLLGRGVLSSNLIREKKYMDA